MTVYMPILKGRESELVALGNIPDEQRSRVRPILEACPTDNGDPQNRTLSMEATTFSGRASANLPRNRAFAVDCDRLVKRYGRPDSGGAMSVVADAMAREGFKIIPVFRQTDTPDDIAQVAYVSAQHGGGACLRLAWTAPRGADRDAKLSRLLRNDLRLGFAMVDLVIDLWEVISDYDYTAGIRRAQQALAWAMPKPWRSINLACAAFPKGLSDLPFDGPAAVPRRDAELWYKVAGSRNGIGYGDCGVANPRMPPGRTPHPNLRYTSDEDWIIYRCPRGQGSGAYGCFRDLCRAVITSEHWATRGSAFSWGDEQIELYANGHAGPRNDPSGWRACGMSHHFATVLNRLEHLGRP